MRGNDRDDQAIFGNLDLLDEHSLQTNQLATGFSRKGLYLYRDGPENPVLFKAGMNGRSLFGAWVVGNC